ncbi:helix-turn-helix domain-containing protein [Granulicella rosea]|uniref:helix-turn-helix domain-containing protein n=1 Tax=Granulicella rosea TaxID=474952 RepID=UPI003CCBE47F
MSLIRGFRQLLPTLQGVAARAKPDARKSRKGRNKDLREYYERVLSKLIAARIESGLTQREVSLRLGMAHSFMNKCESGERAIDIAELWAISNIYGKPLSHFAPDKL